MLVSMVNNNNNNNDEVPVTRGFLRETLQVALDNVVTRISAKIDEKIDTAIGDLAIMVEKGFQGMGKQIDERFAQVDVRFVQIDARFDKMDERFAQMDARFDRMDARFAKMDIRFERVEKDISAISLEVKETRKEIVANDRRARADGASLDLRVNKLEKRVRS